MSNRPDLHTDKHDKWDQGGYYNNLVVDDDGSGTDCGYRKERANEDRDYWYCPSCYGVGRMSEVAPAREGEMVTCPDCGGSGRAADSVTVNGFACDVHGNDCAADCVHRGGPRESEHEKGTLGWHMADIEAKAKALGAHATLAGVDQLRARLRNERDNILFGEWRKKTI